VANYIEDDDNGIYLFENGKRGEKIAYAATPTSFVNMDDPIHPNPMRGAVINPKDMSGKNFLNQIKKNDPFTLVYAWKARNNKEWDFKVTNGTGEHYTDANINDFFRGMPIIGEIEGLPIWASARDIGNIAAGFVLGRNGWPWSVGRFGLDGYQSIAEGEFTSESIGTQLAQNLGYRIGSEYDAVELFYERQRLPGAGYLKGQQAPTIFKGIITWKGFKE
jgi:hypothetical protein